MLISNKYVEARKRLRIAYMVQTGGDKRNLDKCIRADQEEEGKAFFFTELDSVGPDKSGIKGNEEQG